MGMGKVCCDYMSQLYALWLAVLIKQILKDPIHKLHRQIWCYHITTIIVSFSLTMMMGLVYDYGVEVKRIRITGIDRFEMWNTSHTRF